MFCGASSASNAPGPSASMASLSGKRRVNGPLHLSITFSNPEASIKDTMDVKLGLTLATSKTLGSQSTLLLLPPKVKTSQKSGASYAHKTV